MEEIDLDFEAAKFCYKCGAELVVLREPYGYNRVTREPVFKFSKKCPNYEDKKYTYVSGHDWLTRHERVQ